MPGADFLCPAECECHCLGDPICDAIVNILDVVRVIDVAFRGYPAEYDTWCWYAGTDVDCSGFTNVLDAVRIVNVAFRDGDPGLQFCVPCMP